MAAKKKAKQKGDVKKEITSYAKKNGYPAEHFAECVCKCGSRTFFLSLDDTCGAAERRCAKCTKKHLIGDSAEYVDEATLDECQCPCGSEELEITIAVSLYDDSKDVRWLYVGCRCTKCGLAAVYGDWKNEFSDYRKLLKNV